MLEYTVIVMSFFGLLFFLLTFRSLKRQQALLNEQVKLSAKVVHLLEQLNNTKINHDKEELQKEWRSYVYLQALIVRDAVYKQTKGIHVKAIEEAPKQAGLSDKELIDTFSAAELQAIHTFWSLFNNYLETYWLTAKGTYKTVFKGLLGHENSEIEQIRNASSQLTKKLDELLIQMRQRE